jgi:hypothetical protein
MGGTLDETTFTDYEIQAESVIDYVTFDRLRHDTIFTERVRYCVYQLIKMVELKMQASTLGGENAGSAITSQSNDGVSVSYNVLSASDVYKTSQDEMIKLIKMYLSGEKNSKGYLLLYRGVYPNEQLS